MNRQETEVTYQKGRIKLDVHSQESVTFKWFELFIPQEHPGDTEDLSKAIVTVKSWTGDSPGSAPMEPIDPVVRGWWKIFMFDISSVTSAQVPYYSYNSLPTIKYKDTPNNPMLMATTTGTSASLYINAIAPIELREHLYVGVRKLGETSVIGWKKVDASGVTKLDFTAIEGCETYEVVAGYDENKNGSLDSSEVQFIFKKTPQGNATSGLQFIDKIRIVTQVEFENSVDNLLVKANLFGTGFAGDLLKAFVEGSTSVPDTTLIEEIPIAWNQPGLSHPLGGKWNSSGNDKTYKYVFGNSSQAASDFFDSNGFRIALSNHILQKKAELIAAYTGADEWQTSWPPMTFNAEISFNDTDAGKLPWNRLGLAFGKVKVNGMVSLKYKVSGPNVITVNEIEFNGGFSDLYDFAYGGGDQALIASKVQAGHATLTTNPLTGKVFFTQLLLSGWRLYFGVY